MNGNLYINLPVTDLERATAFYTAIGGTSYPRFSDARTSGIGLTEQLFVMLLTHDRFAEFTSRRIVDARNEIQTLHALQFDDRDALGEVIERGVAAGGVADPNPPQDHGFMFGRSIADPDGHIWEFFWMGPAHLATEETA